MTDPVPGDVPDELVQKVQWAIREAADECGIILAADEGENALRFFDLATDAVLAVVLPVVRQQAADQIEREGREAVQFLAGDETQLGRYRLVGAEDAYKDAIRVVRGEE